ncbi:MAG: nitrogen regulation protein NR(II) [Paracoccaceae bacterium]
MTRQAARGLRIDSNLLDVVIQTAPDAIVTIDHQGSILSFSPAAERMFGYTDDEVVGQNVRMLMPTPHRARHDQYLAHYLQTGERRIIGIGREVRAMRRSGEPFIAELAVGELKTNDQHIFTGFIRDVTDRVEAERKARRLQRMLDRVSRIQALGEMSTALAHELNQPLAAITGFARAAGRILDRDPPETGKARVQLDRISEEAQRAGEILRRMRKLVDRGQGDFRPEDLNGLVREAIALCRVGSDYSRLRVRYDLAEDLPPVYADRVQIQQVVVNLVRNAAEAIADDPDGDVHITTEIADPVDELRIRADRTPSDDVMVTIGDAGPGIPPELAERLFDPFVTTKDAGLGIGLAVCRTIIQSHGGRIWVEANEAGGADFHFTLPIARP